MDDLIPKSPNIEKELVIKSCKTCIHPGPSDIGCPAQECHDCCQLSNWQEKDPLPRSRSGNPNQGGATEENNILEGLPMVERGSEMAPELLEFAQQLKNEARLHNIKVEQMIKKIDEFMSHDINFR